MFDDFVENTYILPVVLSIAGVILWAVYLILRYQKKDKSLIIKVSALLNFVFLLWALILFYLTVREELFQNGKFDKSLLKFAWPFLFSLLLIVGLTLIKKYRNHPAGIFASSLILLGGFYFFIKLLESSGQT